ncbi:uncharacterized protein HMPREF1120_05207 [Exophiala dermatitidis NIH/UT8656]|uniref:Uncharacterized protein n=1 Tax=Exophiala dermatitidis (strain ATCC 34100 / CBS 525.76 / NIH/UT8656) TaxID=858893 RepID=H6C010_EXODN|nr:uncharacterized protein HMPREF1120_05207 [Exophiala dermatitidis NIH/UT8656]EHY57159.1 hypothetical protein HMPREF1120_05207 [Exophiala dermatitidis NIH/UT8656]KAJ4664998.1 hypothetical protein HRR92_008098 [Exophiala dermatitidis]
MPAEPYLQALPDHCSALCLTLNEPSTAPTAGLRVALEALHLDTRIEFLVVRVSPLTEICLNAGEIQRRDDSLADVAPSSSSWPMPAPLLLLLLLLTRLLLNATSNLTYRSRISNDTIHSPFPPSIISKEIFLAHPQIGGVYTDISNGEISFQSCSF